MNLNGDAVKFLEFEVAEGPANFGAREYPIRIATSPPLLIHSATHHVEPYLSLSFSPPPPLSLFPAAALAPSGEIQTLLRNIQLLFQIHHIRS
jgi:hypothetical protein